MGSLPPSRVSLLRLVSVAVALSGCISLGKSTTDSEDEGYFVALTAETGSLEALTIYDGLYDAINTYNRQRAASKGRLTEHVAKLEADGYTRLYDGTNEIECDVKKCLVKLSSRHLKADSGDQDALAVHLTKALAGQGITPKRIGEGPKQSRVYVLGKQPGLHISCAEHGTGSLASYACDFDLTHGLNAAATLDPVARGRLVSCALSPGTTRSAQEAATEVEGGGLLKITAPGSSHTVGYLRFAAQGRSVEFLDLFLCGDLSHDHFHVEGAARQPRAWLPRALTPGANSVSLQTLQADGVRLDVYATVLEENAEDVALEVSFKVSRDGAATAEAYGQDRFVVRMRRSWLR